MTPEKPIQNKESKAVKLLDDYRRLENEWEELSRLHSLTRDFILKGRHLPTPTKEELGKLRDELGQIYSRKREILNEQEAIEMTILAD